MPNCASFGCVNRSGDRSLMFHQIPGSERDKALRKKWLINIRREGQLPKDKCFYIYVQNTLKMNVMKEI